MTNEKLLKEFKKSKLVFLVWIFLFMFTTIIGLYERCTSSFLAIYFCMACIVFINSEYQKKFKTLWDEV